MYQYVIQKIKILLLILKFDLFQSPTLLMVVQQWLQH